ncbi:hypothetical protein ACO0LL_22575 [Undibacterium sp. TC4M20W]|uniref:hypothetical protein n=1 Tax=Undibacterium sp. TC4M20W TaxID=3413052 RepID=UPI003BF09A54
MHNFAKLGLFAAATTILTILSISVHAQTPPAPTATDITPASMNMLGREGDALASRVGLWDVVETAWSRPGATPEIIRGQVAERRMVGLYLQELLHPSADAVGKGVNRLDYLGFNRVTGRWEYLSMDARVAVGLMPAGSFDKDNVERIRVQFDPFVVPGSGNVVTGQLLRMEQVYEKSGPDNEVKNQYFILADGSGTKWLAHQYIYTRRNLQ